MTRDDAYAFSDALRAAFPRLRFVRYDHADKFFDYPAWKRACDKAGKIGTRTPRQLDYTRDPKEELPDYFQSLADVSDRHFWVWIEPPNWRPRWRRRDRAGILVIENFPRLHLEFTRGGFELPDPRRAKERQDDPDSPLSGLEVQPLSLDRNEAIVLTGGRMLGAWNKGDQTAKAFVQKVWRILGKMSTNRLVEVAPRTRQPIPPNGAATTEPYLRAATGALRWARWRRHNYLKWGGQWYKPEGYFDR